MNRNILRIAAASGAVAVTLGAFGAHGLETLAENGKIETDRLSTWDTAVHYHFYHTLALCFLAVVFPYLRKNYADYSKAAFIAGICIFSGSLYILTLSPVLFKQELSWLGAIPPLGGLTFIAGWVLLFFSVKTSST